MAIEFRHGDEVRTIMISRFLLPLLLCLGACASAPMPSDWIQVGRTTKAEIIAQYGEPDLVMVGEGGETAIYGPNPPERPRQTTQVPVVQAGPLGTFTTRDQPIERGLGTRDVNAHARPRPAQEFRIVYDAQDVVRELGE